MPGKFRRGTVVRHKDSGITGVIEEVIPYYHYKVRWVPQGHPPTVIREGLIEKERRRDGGRGK